MLVWMACCAVLANGAAAALLYWELSKNKEQYTGWKEKIPPTDALVYSGIMIVVATALSLFITGFYSNTFLFSLKRALILALLWPLAYTDWKTFRIPNLFIVAGLAVRAVVLAAEFIWERETLFGVMLTEIAAAVVLFLVALACTFVVKNSIGAGDMKLFAVLGLFLGLQGTWGAVFMSLIISFVAAVFLLATKKKSRKDAIPFGPALAAGTYLSIFLTGM